MHRSTIKRTIGVAGLSSLAAAISVVALGSAQASATPQKCGQVSIENSKDGGQTWSTNGRLEGAAPAKISVRLTGDIQKGCEYPVSLASYSAEGATWETSGKQEFLGWDTVKLTSEKTEAALDVSAFAPSCFGQVDLYGNGNKYDGTGGHALPQYPSVVTPDNLITAWNGGAPCESSPSTPPASPSEPATPAPSESESSSPSPSGSESASPSPSGSDSASPSPSESPTPSGSPSSSAPAAGDSPSPSSTVPPASTEPPVGSPIVQPVSTTPTENLAETGGNSSQMVAFSSAGAALLVIGGGAVYFTRRRNRTSAS